MKKQKTKKLQTYIERVFATTLSVLLLSVSFAPPVAAQMVPSPSPTPSPTVTPSPSVSPTPTQIPTPTSMPSPSPTPSVTPSPTPSPEPSVSPSPSPTPSPTVTPTPSPSPSVTPSPTPSPTPEDPDIYDYNPASGAQCPDDLGCRFVPAAYAKNSDDPTDFGNYDHANRPYDMDIKYIVIHNTEGSYQSAIDHFQDPKSYVSCNYVIRSEDGEITQMVRNEDVAWCAGDWYVNMHSINIEHEGFAKDGATWYTEEMYQSSAALVRWLAQEHDIPLDRAHIIGHDNVPTVSPARMKTQHADPGPYWDWNHYMALLHGVSDEEERAASDSYFEEGDVITINPDFATNLLDFNGCVTTGCVTAEGQGSSAVMLRTMPDATAPLVSDPYLHESNTAGTSLLEDWGSRASTGQQFVVAEQLDDWTAIWYGGQKAWFYNPVDNPSAFIAESSIVTPLEIMESVPVYGVAYPEAEAYPEGMTPQSVVKLYDMPAGQFYTTTGEIVPTDYFHDATINYTQPHDHEVIIGDEEYLQITFNHRIGYVKIADVLMDSGVSVGDCDW